jgi:hypothetical protein
MAGMSAAERRKYHAEQRIQADQDRLAARRDRAANREAARKDRAASFSASIADFGHMGQGDLAAGSGEVTGSQVGATDSISSSMIARTASAKVAQARAFIGNMKMLKSAGLNSQSLQDILGMGVAGGSAYAAALVHGDMKDILSINQSQKQLAGMGASFGSFMSATGKGAPTVKVYIGSQELTQMIRVEVDGQSEQLATSMGNGRNGG